MPVTDRTLGAALQSIAPKAWRNRILTWPPDAFGAAAFLLYETGAYLRVVEQWPRKNRSTWTARMRKLGLTWRKMATRRKVPAEISKIWKKILSCSDRPLRSIRSASLMDSASPEGEAIDALLEILAAADEACSGIGLPSDNFDRNPLDRFELEALVMLLAAPLKEQTFTLCKFIDASILAVLPKLHTPQNGITLRSLSHNLAFLAGGEVNARWFWVDLDPPSEQDIRHCLNVLLLPWPLEIAPAAFSAAKRKTFPLKSMPDNYGFFRYHISQPTDFLLKVKSLMDAAEKKVDRIDVVLLPEERSYRHQVRTSLRGMFALRIASTPATSEALESDTFEPSRASIIAGD
jgi:hypothetical protein